MRYHKLDDFESIRELFDSLPNAVFVKDAASKFLLMNQACERQWGIKFAELCETDGSHFFPSGQIEQMLASEREIFASGRQLDFEEVFWDAALKQNRYGHTYKKPVYDKTGKPRYLICTTVDITERKVAEEKLRLRDERFQALFDRASDGILLISSEGKLVAVNQSFAQMHGYTPEEMKGMDLRMLDTPNSRRLLPERIRRIFAGESLTFEVENYRKDGSVFPLEVSSSLIEVNGERLIQSFARDISARKFAADEIYSLAFFDPLTRLPNRRLLQDRIQQALASSARSGRKAALLFIDLDNFKSLNDTLGHDAGDTLIQEVAMRLQSCVREDDTVSRFGGDEFVVVLEGLSRDFLEAAAQTELIGQKIRAELNNHYLLGERKYHNSSSIGATLIDGHRQPQEELLKQVDIAMYQAKQDGRNALRFFDPLMQEKINARAALEADLHLAIEKQQFEMYYQIQVENLGGDDVYRPLGAEALIRWIHPERGLVPPDQFIPLAEETGLILAIGQWALETACEQLYAWQQNELTRELVLAVNVSPRQFMQPDFVNKVSHALQLNIINPRRLKLELTESLVLDNVQHIVETMRVLKDFGILFSLDDFGTGYSSLQYLKQLPFDQLKIDQSFVRGLIADHNDKAIVRTIIAMAQNMNMEVIAEGVEIVEQRRVLSNKGCRHFQGYLFGQPQPITQFETLLQQIRH